MYCHISSQVIYLPSRHYAWDTGIDLYPLIKEPVVIHASQTVKLDTGIYLSIDKPHWILRGLSKVLLGADLIYDVTLRSRSSLASAGVVVSNSPATIDTGYQGRIQVLLTNTGNSYYVIHPQTAIAQLVIGLALYPQKLSTNFGDLSLNARESRGDNAFGSTTSR